MINIYAYIYSEVCIPVHKHRISSLFKHKWNTCHVLYHERKLKSQKKNFLIYLQWHKSQKWNKVKTIKHLELTESESNEYQNWREATKVNFRGIFIASNQEAIRTPQ